MVKNLSFEENNHVLKTWAALKEIPDYHVTIGVTLYQRFFQKCPKAKVLFGWPVEIDPLSPELNKSAVFRKQAALYIELWDGVVDMIGPDIEVLTEILEELGGKHFRQYSVRHEMYDPMGEAFLETLEFHLGSKFFTADVKRAWESVWNELTNDLTHQEIMSYHM